MDTARGGGLYFIFSVVHRDGYYNHYLGTVLYNVPCIQRVRLPRGSGARRSTRSAAPPGRTTTPRPAGSTPPPGKARKTRQKQFLSPPVRASDIFIFIVVFALFYIFCFSGFPFPSPAPDPYPRASLI